MVYVLTGCIMLFDINFSNGQVHPNLFLCILINMHERTSLTTLILENDPNETFQAYSSFRLCFILISRKGIELDKVDQEVD